MANIMLSATDIAGWEGCFHAQENAEKILRRVQERVRFVELLTQETAVGFTYPCTDCYLNRR